LGEGDACESAAVKLLNDLGTLRRGPVASLLGSVFRFHGSSLSLRLWRRQMYPAYRLPYSHAKFEKTPIEPKIVPVTFQTLSI
jgi:hypothetical protein